MGSRFAKSLVGGIDTRLQFFQGELGCTRFNPRGHYASRGHELNYINSLLDLQSSSLENFIRTIGLKTDLPAVSTGHTDHLTCAQHPGPGKEARRYGVSNVDINMVLGTKITDRGHA